MLQKKRAGIRLLSVLGYRSFSYVYKVLSFSSKITNTKEDLEALLSSGINNSQQDFHCTTIKVGRLRKRDLRMLPTKVTM